MHIKINYLGISKVSPMIILSDRSSLNSLISLTEILYLSEMWLKVWPGETLCVIIDE